MTPLVLCALLFTLLPVGYVQGQIQTPAAPAINSIGVGDGSLTLEWTAPSGVDAASITAYDLRHIASASPDKTDPDNWTVKRDIWTSGDLIYVLHGLVNGTEHDVQIRAVTDTDGAWSATSTAMPNDFGDARQTSYSLSLNTPIGGTISSEDDRDYFRIRLTRTTELVAYTTGDTDTVGALLDSQGKAIDFNDDAYLGHGVRNFLIGENLAAGTYYIEVESWGSEGGSYTLHANTFMDTSGATDARPIELDGFAMGVLPSDSDEDYFKLELAEAADVIIRSAGDVYDTEGELFAADLTSIATGDLGYLPSNWSQFVIRASLQSGVYYIKINAAPGDHGRYVLLVDKVTEPGNTRANATPLTFGKAEGGRINPSNDRDYFRFRITKNRLVLIRASSYDVDIVGDLLNHSGQLVNKEVIEQTFLDDGPWGFVLYRYLDAGTYYLRVTGSGSGKTGPYSLLAYTVAVDNESYNRFRTGCKQIVTVYEDPLYGCQWHLNNTGQLDGAEGEDINIEDVWETNMGAGVNVAVVDEGILFNHEDLIDNVNEDHSHDYTAGAAQFPLFHNHGTAVAGLIAARDNDLGVRGVAPRATIYGYNVLDNLTLFSISDAMIRNAATTAVSNNSWGFPDGPELDSVSRFWELAIDQGVSEGYGGKGIFYAWAGGNGGSVDNSNFDEYANYYGVTAVCAVNDLGVRSLYSEQGANLWICGPASDDSSRNRPRITTTYRAGLYTPDFGGTSAATPIVAGVVALLREANPDLTWRDLKLILAATARKNDSENDGWETGARKYDSDSDTDTYSFNHEYGFGVVDAKAALDEAADWDPVSPLIETEPVSASPDRTIPDLGSISSTITAGSEVGFIEFVEINVNFEAPAFRSLRIELESPSGSVSQLVQPLTPTQFNNFLNYWDPYELQGAYRFGSARHLGESPSGEWTLKVDDTISEQTPPTLKSWNLTFYGHRQSPGAPGIDSVTQDADSLTVNWTAPTHIVASPITSYEVRHIRSDAADKADANWIVMEEAWTSGALRYKITNLTDGVSYDVQVRGVNDEGEGLWSETKTGIVGGVNSPPVFTEGAAADRTVREDSAVGTSVGSPVRAVDIDDDTLTYGISGADSHLFAIDAGTGQITVNSPTGLDRETRLIYSVTVSVQDGKSPTGTTSAAIDDLIDVDITLLDQNEPLEISGPATSILREGFTWVGSYSASDPENAVVTWSVAGTDSGDFQIDEAGVLLFRVRPDYETPADSDRNNDYEVTVRASDGTHTAPLDVLVTVVDHNESPVLTGARSVGYLENGMGAVTDYNAADPENDTIEWKVTGTDADDFKINDSGELSFETSPDHENPTDRNGDNVYQVTVNAADDFLNAALAVVVTVTNRDEIGTLTLSSPQPQVDTLLEAVLADPDGGLTDQVWKWERSLNRSALDHHHCRNFLPATHPRTTMWTIICG